MIEYDRYRDDRDRLLVELAGELGASVVHPYDDPRVIAGAATCALELVQDAGSLATVVVPVGGGGLLSGSAISLRAVSPATRIVGVEPEASPDMQRSFRAAGGSPSRSSPRSPTVSCSTSPARSRSG